MDDAPCSFRIENGQGVVTINGKSHPVATKKEARKLLIGMWKLSQGSLHDKALALPSWTNAMIAVQKWKLPN